MQLLVASRKADVKVCQQLKTGTMPIKANAATTYYE